MAGEMNGAFLPLEGLGGNRTNYGRSGASNHLLPLTGGGAAYRRSAGAMTVPMSRIALTMRTGDKFAAAMTAPRIVVVGRGGMTATMTAPMSVLSTTGTSPIILRAELTSPSPVVYGTVRVGSKAGAALTTPMQVLFTDMGGRVILTTPMQRLAGRVTAMEYARARLTAPAPAVTGTISVYSYPWRAALTTPLIVAGPYGRAALMTPMASVYGHAGVLAAIADFEAWVLNVRNKGVTRWTNYPFTQFTRVGSSTYAVGNDGNLYLLGGDLDVAAPIAWEFETGLSDLDSPALKHMPYLYVGGIIDGNVDIVVLDDRGREFGYEYDTKQRGAVHQTHRRKLGNGIRTTNVGFRISSPSGAYAEIDWLGPELTNTGRNI